MLHTSDGPQGKEAAVRTVLGHFFFGYLHPYMDGNGRMGRLLMNAALASGGYPWRVIPLAERATGIWRDSGNCDTLNSCIHRADTNMATSIRLDPATEQRLEQLAARTGRTKAYYLRELVANGLDDLEDYYLAAATVERVRKGEEKVYTAEQVRKDLGLDD
jgi:RHH-type rel operon transcriptional repressor/antitoxin RelB